MMRLRQVTNKEASKYVVTTLDEVCKENREIAKLFASLSGTELDPIDVVSLLITRDDEILVALPAPSTRQPAGLVVIGGGGRPSARAPLEAQAPSAKGRRRVARARLPPPACRPALG